MRAEPVTPNQRRYLLRLSPAFTVTVILVPWAAGAARAVPGAAASAKTKASAISPPNPAASITFRIFICASLQGVRRRAAAHALHCADETRRAAVRDAAKASAPIVLPRPRSRYFGRKWPR